MVNVSKTSKDMTKLFSKMNTQFSSPSNNVWESKILLILVSIYIVRVLKDILTVVPCFFFFFLHFHNEKH